MSPRTFHDGRVILHEGDCLATLDALAENSVDSVVCDPPYHLTSIVKRFGGANAAPLKVSEFFDEGGKSKGSSAYKRASAGFMGKQWDGGDIAFRIETWAKVLRVLKPGGHLLAFSGTRTYHRMVCAIEDAGFEIRDQIGWAFGSGFPKSHDVSKAIDKAAGAEREVVGVSPYLARRVENKVRPNTSNVDGYVNAETSANITAPATDAAREWQGWGTALKPSFEPVVWAQKPWNKKENIDIIGSTITRLWSQLWSMLSAKDVAQLFTLSPSACGVDPSASAQWSADDASNTRAALCAQMDTSQFEMALISSLSTVSLWSGTLAENLAGESTCITETESSTTIDLKTLRCSLSRITPESIILAHKSGVWSSASVSPAERYLYAVVTKLSATRELSVLASALQPPPTCSLDETGPIAPNWEPICVARKPLDSSSIAANILKWGVGGLNIDGCRVPASESWRPSGKANGGDSVTDYGDGLNNSGRSGSSPLGRWPANLCHDGSPEVLACFPDAPGQQRATGPEFKSERNVYGKYAESAAHEPRNDSGSAARFFNQFEFGAADRLFYSAKASAKDRAESSHPTVKPIAIMRHLVRLVTPPGGTVLDCFAGTGTTAHAALLEGMRAILCEREAEYCADIERRMSLVYAGPDERVGKLVKQDKHDALPLFGAAE